MSHVRLVRPSELEVLRSIEVASGQLFAEIGMHEVAADEPAALGVLAGYQRDGRAWASVDDEDRPVGYALAFELEGLAHLEQLSVDPEHGREGRGRTLVEAVITWARACGLPAVTLSTFRDVAWNAPYYERSGFRILAEEELTPGLLALRAVEAGHGLDTSARVFMHRDA